MTSSRETVFASVRRALGVTSREAPRRQEVEARLAGHPAGLVPARAQMPLEARLALFRDMVLAAAATIDHLPSADAVPGAIAA